MIFVRPGSGKSTFALLISKILELPLYHIDKYFFIENWAERDHNEFLDIQYAFVSGDSWIIDGNAIKSLEMRYSNADLILYFNYPRYICYWRVFKRSLYKDEQIQDRAYGCENTTNFALLKYIWSFEKRVKYIISSLKQKYPDKLFIEIRDDNALYAIKQEIKNPEIHKKSKI